MISVMRISRALPTLLKRGSFRVNILHEGDGTLARKFAADPTLRWQNTQFDPSAASRHPELSDALVWIDCEVCEVVHVGGHAMVLASARALGDQADTPLVCVQGGFRQLAVA